MIDAVPRRRRRWPWVVAILGLVVAAVPATYIVASVTGPSPRLAQVEQEPILTAPIDAVELGRATRQSQYGVGLPNVSAYVVVAYQVEVTSQEALDAWVSAYGARYALQDAHDPLVMMFIGSTTDTYVRVAVSDRVEDTDDGGNLARPHPGSTVVTVEVSGIS